MKDQAIETRATALRRNNNFDSLRLIFASLVIFSHSPELVDGNRNRELLTRLFGTITFGQVALVGFFALSGYLIPQSWERSPQLGDFLKKRVLRIYPGFIVASLLTALVFAPLATDSAAYFQQFNIGAFVGGMARLVIPQTPPSPVGNGSMWTIQAEFICYLLVALMGVIGLSKQRFLAPVLYLLLVLLCIYKRGVYAPYSFFGCFLAGSCFYTFREQVRLSKRGALIAGALLLLGMFHPVGVWLAISTAGVYLLFCVAFAHAPRLHGLSGRVDVSYGIYLYAWPIQTLTIHYFPAISPWLVFVTAWPLSYLCGLLSWHLVEHPFLKLKKRGSKIQREVAA